MSADVLGRRARAADVGMWLFLASLVMFFGSLYSGYVLLRAGSEMWTAPWLDAWPRWTVVPTHWLTAGLLAVAVGQVRRYRVSAAAGNGDTRRRILLVSASLMGVLVVMFWVLSTAPFLQEGRGPASSVAVASWFVLTGAVTGLVLAGAIATLWIGVRSRGAVAPTHVARNVERYWWLMLAFHLSVVIGMYLA